MTFSFASNESSQTTTSNSSSSSLTDLLATGTIDTSSSTAGTEIDAVTNEDYASSEITTLEFTFSDSLNTASSGGGFNSNLMTSMSASGNIDSSESDQGHATTGGVYDTFEGEFESEYTSTISFSVASTSNAFDGTSNNSTSSFSAEGGMQNSASVTADYEEVGGYRTATGTDAASDSMSMSFSLASSNSTTNAEGGQSQSMSVFGSMSNGFSESNDYTEDGPEKESSGTFALSSGMQFGYTYLSSSTTAGAVPGSESLAASGNFAMTHADSGNFGYAIDAQAEVSNNIDGSFSFTMEFDNAYELFYSGLSETNPTGTNTTVWTTTGTNQMTYSDSGSYTGYGDGSAYVSFTSGTFSSSASSTSSTVWHTEDTELVDVGSEVLVVFTVTDISTETTNSSSQSGSYDPYNTSGSGLSTVSVTSASAWVETTNGTVTDSGTGLLVDVSQTSFVVGAKPNPNLPDSTTTGIDFDGIVEIYHPVEGPHLSAQYRAQLITKNFEKATNGGVTGISPEEVEVGLETALRNRGITYTGKPGSLNEAFAEAKLRQKRAELLDMLTSVLRASFPLSSMAARIIVATAVSAQINSNGEKVVADEDNGVPANYVAWMDNFAKNGIKLYESMAKARAAAEELSFDGIIFVKDAQGRLRVFYVDAMVGPNKMTFVGFFHPTTFLVERKVDGKRLVAAIADVESEVAKSFGVWDWAANGGTLRTTGDWDEWFKMRSLSWDKNSWLAFMMKRNPRFANDIRASANLSAEMAAMAIEHNATGITLVTLTTPVAIAGAISQFDLMLTRIVPKSLHLQLKLPRAIQRALLRIALQAYKSGKVAHHIIPLEALDKFRTLFIKAAKGGFNINGKGNGILLKITDHIAGHRGYSQAVLEALSKIPTSLSPEASARELQAVADKLRRAIKAGTFGPWF